MKPVPVLQALVLAERIWRTEDRRWIIGGTFNEIQFDPGQKRRNPDPDVGSLVGSTALGSPWVYVVLTEVCDGTSVAIQFVSLKKNCVLFSVNVSMMCRDRLVPVEVVLPLPNLGDFIEEEGTYALEVVCGGDILGSAKVMAKFATGKPS